MVLEADQDREGYCRNVTKNVVSLGVLRMKTNRSNLLISIERKVKGMHCIACILPVSLSSIIRPPVNNFNLEVM